MTVTKDMQVRPIDPLEFQLFWYHQLSFHLIIMQPVLKIKFTNETYFPSEKKSGKTFVTWCIYHVNSFKRNIKKWCVLFQVFFFFHLSFR